ncbi:MAG: PKD domain-containing protein [Gammaproteobacteria bacterium]
MKLTGVLLGSLLAVTTVPVMAAANLPGATGKLSARLAMVAELAAHHQTQSVMARSLTQQLFRRAAPLSPRWNASGAVQVYLHFNRYGGTPDAAALTALGATDVIVSRGLDVVQAWIPAGKLPAAAALQNVTRITVPRYALVKRQPPAPPSPRTGSVDTAGDQILGAAQYRQLTGYTGKGVAVGVISDGDDQIATSQASGDLPSVIWNDPNDAGSFKSAGDEGTAMMEIVYDLAPGVQLGFCGPQTTVDFVTCLSDFANHFGNINLVIVDDLGFAGVAMFTDGSFASAVASFSSANPAVRLLTAAGNDAEGFWAGSWNPLALPNSVVNNGKPVTINGITYASLQNFGTSESPLTSLTMTVQPGDTLNWVVEWGDTWVPSNTVTSSTPNDPNDYDVVLTGANGNVLVCNIGSNFGGVAAPPSPASCPFSGTAGPTNTPGPQPIQGNSWDNTGSSAATVYLEILYAAADGSPDTHLKILASTTNSQILLSPVTPAGSIYGQSALPYPAEITVGAVSALNNPNYQIEPYSSQGPVFLFQPASGPSTRMKPDIVGVDCVTTTGAGNFSEPFCGTSAAAPHIAGLIALFESGFPSVDPYAMLKAGAMELGNGSPNGVYGYGLPNAVRSAAAQYPAPSASILSPANNVAVSPNNTLNFTGTCAANGAPGGMTYDWNFGASSGIPGASTPNPSVSYTSGGQYSVTLTCTNAFGVTATASVSLTVTSGKSGGGGFGLALLAVLLLLEAARLRRQRSETSQS